MRKQQRHRSIHTRPWHAICTTKLYFFFYISYKKSCKMLLSMSHDSLSNVVQQSHNDYARQVFNLQTIQQLFYHQMSREFDLTDMLRTAACLLATFATEA